MPRQENALSRNPNVCASCSSMADGMEHSPIPDHEHPATNSDRTTGTQAVDEGAKPAARSLSARR